MRKIKLKGKVVDYDKRLNLLKLSLKSVQTENKEVEDVSEPLILHCFWDDALLDNKAPSEMPTGDEAVVTVNINGKFFFISAIERIPVLKAGKTISLIEYMEELIYHSGKELKHKSV